MKRRSFLTALGLGPVAAAIGCKGASAKVGEASSPMTLMMGQGAEIANLKVGEEGPELFSPIKFNKLTSGDGKLVMTVDTIHFRT